jgi:hypothetical protein
MSITSATTQSEEASDKRFNAIVFSFSLVVVMFLTPFAILMKNGRYLRALQAKSAVVHHLVMSGSCIPLSRSCGISLAVLKTSLVGMGLSPTVFFQIAFDRFAPSSFQLFIKRENCMQQLDCILGFKATVTNILLKSQAENRL